METQETLNDGLDRASVCVATTTLKQSSRFRLLSSSVDSPGTGRIVRQVQSDEAREQGCGTGVRRSQQGQGAGVWDGGPEVSTKPENRDVQSVRDAVQRSHCDTFCYVY